MEDYKNMPVSIYFQTVWNKDVDAKLNTYPAHFNKNLKVPFYKTLLTERWGRGSYNFLQITKSRAKNL